MKACISKGVPHRIRARLRARMHVRIYYNVSLPFISLFPAFFMLYNIFTNQRVRKKFQKY